MQTRLASTHEVIFEHPDHSYLWNLTITHRMLSGTSHQTPPILKSDATQSYQTITQHSLLIKRGWKSKTQLSRTFRIKFLRQLLIEIIIWMDRIQICTSNTTKFRLSNNNNNNWNNMSLAAIIIIITVIYLTLHFIFYHHQTFHLANRKL